MQKLGGVPCQAATAPIRQGDRGGGPLSRRQLRRPPCPAYKSTSLPRASPERPPSCLRSCRLSAPPPRSPTLPTLFWPIERAARPSPAQLPTPNRRRLPRSTASLAFHLVTNYYSNHYPNHTYSTTTTREPALPSTPRCSPPNVSLPLVSLPPPHSYSPADSSHSFYRGHPPVSRRPGRLPRTQVLPDPQRSRAHRPQLQEYHQETHERP